MNEISRPLTRLHFSLGERTLRNLILPQPASQPDSCRITAQRHRLERNQSSVRPALTLMSHFRLCLRAEQAAVAVATSIGLDKFISLGIWVSLISFVNQRPHLNSSLRSPSKRRDQPARRGHTHRLPLSSSHLIPHRPLDRFRREISKISDGYERRDSPDIRICILLQLSQRGDDSSLGDVLALG